MKTITLNAENRDLKLKASSLRKEGKIPAVIYGGDVVEHITTTIGEVKHLIYTPDFKLADVSVNGKNHQCIIKDVQFHPTRDTVEHIDFLAIENGRKVKVEIPVRFKGESPGVKLGGKLMQSLRKVKVKLDPKDLVEELFVDISSLELGDAIRVRDIESDDNLEIMIDPAIPIAVVEVPRAVKTEEVAEDAPAAGEGDAAAAEGGDAPAESK